MIRIAILLFFLCGRAGLFAEVTDTVPSVVSVRFYSEELLIPYSPEMILRAKTPVRERDMVSYFHRMEKTDFRTLLEDLEDKKERLQLNDWLFFKLLEQCIRKIYGPGRELEKELSCWFLLSKAGFDTRLTYRDDQVFVYVYSQDEVYYVPVIEEGKRSYLNLTSMIKNLSSQKSLFLLRFTPNPEGRSFTFYLDRLPDLQPWPEVKSLQFPFRQVSYELNVHIDLTVVELMSSYPAIAERQYLEVALSPTLMHSLVPQLNDRTEGLSETESLALLATFTRSSFCYKQDTEHFGRNRPMIADEVFYYPYSDCEDRSALFYCLVKELFDLPMIIIAYEDHLTIGVAAQGLEGTPIHYAGRDYFICDPTGPIGSSQIGHPPDGYENAPFEIIGDYTGERNRGY